MKLSTRGRYGVRALLDLAAHQGEGPVLLKDIARRQEVSLAYLEHLIAPLVAGGLVKSTRGARGGVLLLKPPSAIKLSEVVQLLEAPLPRWTASITLIYATGLLSVLPGISGLR